MSDVQSEAAYLNYLAQKERRKRCEQHLSGEKPMTVEEFRKMQAEALRDSGI